MSTIYPIYHEAAHHEINRRLRAADDERRRRLTGHSLRSTLRAGAETARRWSASA
jgi:hypothetical protein